MSESTELVQQQRAPAVRYREQVVRFAGDFVTTQVGEEEARKLTGRFSLAFREAALKNPDLYSVPPVQVAWAIARSAMTGLMPGGPTPHVDLIVRKGQLNWQVSSRGWQKLGEDAGWHIEAIEVMDDDHFRFEREVDPATGELRVIIEHKPDPWGDRTDYEQLKGFLVVARDISGRSLPPRYRLVTKFQIEDIRKTSEAKYAGAPWNRWPMAMAEKTVKSYVIRRGMVPLSRAVGDRVQMANALEDAPPPVTVAVVDAGEAPPGRDGMAGVADLVADMEQPALTNGGGQPIDTVEQIRERERKEAAARWAAAEREREEAEPEDEDETPGEPEDEPDGDDDAEQLLEEVKRLEGEIDERTRDRLRRNAGKGTKIRLRSYNKKVAKYHSMLLAHLAKVEPEPEDEDESDDEPPWSQDEVAANMKQLTPGDRKVVCTTAGVAFDDFSTPVWKTLTAQQLQKIGNLADDRLAELE